MKDVVDVDDGCYEDEEQVGVGLKVRLRLRGAARTADEGVGGKWWRRGYVARRGDRGSFTMWAGGGGR